MYLIKKVSLLNLSFTTLVFGQETNINKPVVTNGDKLLFLARPAN